MKREKMGCPAPDAAGDPTVESVDNSQDLADAGSLEDILGDAGDDDLDEEEDI